MARLVRAALVALSLLALALSSASAAGPTLGGRLSPVPLVYEQQQAVNVTSLANIPVVVQLSVTGNGWQLAAYSLSLAPGERQSVAVTAAGEDAATISARITPDPPIAGNERARWCCRARYGTSWLESIPWLDLGLLGLLAVLVAFRLLRRRFSEVSR